MKNVKGRDLDLNTLNFNKIKALINNEAFILITDINGVIIYVNEKCSMMVGYESDEIVGKHTRIFKTGHHTMEFYRDLWNTVLSGDIWKGEMNVKRKDGSFTWNFLSIIPLLDENNRPYQFLTLRTDITELKEIEEQARQKEKQLMSLIELEQARFYQKIEQMEYSDYLTGLPNRRNINNRLKEDIEKAKENNSTITILILDLDEFKYVNDTVGHELGDILLMMISSRLKSALGNEIFLGRLGGDEFIIIMPDMDVFGNIQKVGDTLLSAINKKPFNMNGDDFYISSSIGASVYPFSGENKEVLLKHAEMAMYRAKEKGKNQCQIFSPTMNIFSSKQFILRNDLKKALINNEFCIYYQPRFNPYTQEMVSAEALIRWNHPKRGMVSPGEFISMAEESGLIIQIGAWMINNVCQQIKKWEMEKLKIKKISINLSSLQLLQPNFSEMVSSILRETRVDYKWIEFEITESVMIDEEEQVLVTIRQLTNLGITFALDDFGTGYSSLNYLRRFPFETVKIDQSLIKEIQNDPNNYEIVTAIIALCHRLKKEVVAEGVETKDQLLLLQKCHCDQIQGYLYSKPINSYQFKELLKEGKWNEYAKSHFKGKLKEKPILPDCRFLHNTTK